MASLTVTSCEKWACVNDHDEFEGLQICKINGTHAFLMSLMDEIQDKVEEGDEERLNSVIQSLEAEINSSTMDADQDSCMEHSDHQFISDGEDGTQSFSLGQMDGQDCSVSFDDFDINGCDIDMEVVPCSPSQELNWYMYSASTRGDDYEISNDYYANSIYCGVALDQEHVQNSLWKETTYDSMMYNYD